MNPDRIMRVALAFMECHGVTGDGRPRNLTARELRDVARYFMHPRPADTKRGESIVRYWTFADRRAVRAFPRQFTTLAEGGEVFRCADYGCPCGWSYRFAPGEPMAAPLAADGVPAGR